MLNTCSSGVSQISHEVRSSTRVFELKPPLSPEADHILTVLESTHSENESKSTPSCATSFFEWGVKLVCKRPGHDSAGIAKRGSEVEIVCRASIFKNCILNKLIRMFQLIPNQASQSDVKLHLACQSLKPRCIQIEAQTCTSQF